MKKLLLLLFLTTPLFAQIGNTTTQAFPGVPTGPCSGVTSYAINTAGQTLYICPGGTWHLISAGGGGSTFPVTGSTVDANDAGSATMSVDAHGSPAGTGDGNALAAYFRAGAGSFSLPGFQLLSGSGFKENTHSASNIDWTWTDKANDYIGIKADATTSQAGLVVSSLGCYDFASSGNLSANAGMNVDTTICRTAPQVLNFGDATNTGTITTSGAKISLPDGTNGNASLFFTADTPSLGFVRVGGVNDIIHWWDDTGTGGGNWGWSGTNLASLWVNEGLGAAFFGFTTDATNGTCSHCLVPTSTGIGSSTDGTNPNATFTVSRLLTNTKCAATGTSANPSLVACSGASVGVFSCATTASTGTCIVSSTAVTASSTILVNPSSAEGTQIGVTCNTAPTLVPTILLKTKTAGSFTINMPTITTNPECFTFLVVN